MKISSFLVIKAIVSLVLGITFVLVPVALISWYGVALDPGGAYMARTFGVGMIGIGLVCWLVRSSNDPQALLSVALALFITDIIGFFVALTAQLSGLVNALGWSTVVIWLIFAVGLGYFRFFRPSAA